MILMNRYVTGWKKLLEIDLEENFTYKKKTKKKIGGKLYLLFFICSFIVHTFFFPSFFIRKGIYRKAKNKLIKIVQIKYDYIKIPCFFIVSSFLSNNLLVAPWH